MSENEEKVWYYGTAEGERLGPFTLGEMSDLAGAGQVGPKTLVWSPGHAEWFPAERISDRLIAARPAVVPPPVPARREVPQPPPVRESAPQPAGEPEPMLDLKPRRASFVFSRILLGILLSMFIGGVTAGVLAANRQPVWPAAVVAAGGSLLAVVSAFAGYRKERYELHDSRVLRHSGGLFSDQTTELEVRNVTHVKLRLPWLRFKFFGIGDVIIETAGNAQPVVMRAIREPEAVHASMRKRMKRNGYDLTEARLLHHEQPSMLGILSECLAAAAGLFFLAAVLAANFAAMFEEAKQAPPSWTAPLAVGLVALLLISFIVVRFLDFRRRNYRVYNDVVVYEEGFLTREHAFIPYENLADANTKQTLFDRILGLSDVQVSCQGTGKEIKFRHIRRAETLSGAIDQLVVVAREKPKLRGGTSRQDGRPANQRPRREEPERVRVSESLTGDLRMHGPRTLVPLLLLVPLIPVWIGATIQAVIRITSTRYTVRPGSLRYSFRFLNVQEREFAYDKITGVVIKRNLWDRMFGTMTLRFWSLGSGQPIEFANIQAQLLDLSTLMRQAGIPDASSDPWEAKPSFGPLVWLRSRVRLLPVLLVLSGGVVALGMEVDPILHWLQLVVVAILTATFINDWLLCGSQRLRFHDHHVEAEQGIVAKRHYFARYSNIKRVTATSYPAGEQGTLEIFVAGEEEVQQAAQQGKGGKRTVMRPCSFTTRFLPGLTGTARLLDDVLSGRIDPSAGAVAAEPLETLVEAKRAVPNAVIKLIIVSVIFVPLVVLLPFTIPFTIVAARRWRYRVEVPRIVLNRGIFFRQETSVLLDRVDSLQQSQGPLNKMFKNGTVTIMTAGSSKPDLILSDSPGYLELYRTIRDNSQ